MLKREEKNNGDRQQRKPRDNRRNNRERESNEPELINKLVKVNRITKVVKGGRNMRFSALIVVGDGNGSVGVGMSKAAEVPVAIEKATAQAKRNMFKVALNGTTIPHEIKGKFGTGCVLMLPAKEGTGVIAGGPVRAVMEACGIKDIRTKSYGTNNAINCVKAAVEGLRELRSPAQIAALRGKSVEEIIG